MKAYPAFATRSGPHWTLIVVEYSLYLDDSGHPKNQPYVVVAGFVATEQQWQHFKPRWETALKKYGLGHTFHMTDFMSEKRSALREDQILGALRTIIREHTVAAFASGVAVEDYRRVNALYTLEEYLGAPYALVGREITKQVRQWQAEMCKPEDRILFFVEQGTLHFGDLEQVAKRDFLPLPHKVPKSSAAVQPGDMLGWEYFNYLRSGKQSVIRKNLFGLLKGRPSTGTVFWEADLLKTCKLANVMTREYKEKFPDKFISFHSEPKRPRRRTL